MKTKITFLLFSTVFFFNLKTTSDIGGTTIPPKGNGGSGLKANTQIPVTISNTGVIEIL